MQLKGNPMNSRIGTIPFLVFLALIVQSAESQTVITFDGSKLKEGDSVSNQFDGAIFSNAIFVLPGEPEFAFNAADFALSDEVLDPESTGFIGPFITVAAVPGTISIQFDNPVSQLSFLAADLDNTDVLAYVAFGPNNNFLGVRGISDDFAGTGDGSARLVEVPWNGVSRLEIRVETAGGGGRWGFDTLTYTEKSSVLLGDVNQDGSVDLLDVAPFIDVLTSNGFQTEADINQDGDVDLLDVAPFVVLLAG